MSPPPKPRLRTAIVPRALLTGAFVAVVPACVLAATTEGCGDSSSGGSDQDVFTYDVSAHFDASDARDKDVFTADVSAHFDGPLPDVNDSDAGDGGDAKADATEDADDAG